VVTQFFEFVIRHALASSAASGWQRATIGIVE
jgi:hypothetical protein